MDRADPATCSTYKPGHVTHYIAVRKYHDRGLLGTVVRFEGDVVVVRTTRGETYRWWHHDPLRLRATIASAGRLVTLIPELPAIRVGGRWFSCTTEPAPCVSYTGVPPEPSVG